MSSFTNQTQCVNKILILPHSVFYLMPRFSTWPVMKSVRHDINTCLSDNVRGAVYNKVNRPVAIAIWGSVRESINNCTCAIIKSYDT